MNKKYNKGKIATPEEIALVMKALEKMNHPQANDWMNLIQNKQFEIWIQKFSELDNFVFVTGSPINDSDPNHD